ncbi:hypothetical protein AGOR_G00103890 [Albula goreensis]|uniref:StAR related lipid transfer domain containing 9 n=1 Tax=Albula goreensis TaxID=1534307 RepID=A0A8T3DDC1_9TELE|nr:hypothetical protein AGOR_G00103890 [Albula goreensis]
MANVKVAIRVRPLSARESSDGGRIAVQVEDKVVRIKNTKLDGRMDSPADSREKLLEFGFDYCYWSVDPEAPHYASQEETPLWRHGRTANDIPNAVANPAGSAQKNPATVSQAAVPRQPHCDQRWAGDWHWIAG